MTKFPLPIRFLCPLLCLLLCLCPFLAGCVARGDATAHSLVLAAISAEQALPAGDIYLLSDSASLRALSTADTGQLPVRISDTALLSDAFGSGGGLSLPAALDGMVDDGAMRFSTAASPSEFIVFHCISHAATETVATLLHDRLDILRREYRGSDHEGMLAHAQVVVMGKYVALLVCNDPETAVVAMRRKIS